MGYTQIIAQSHPPNHPDSCLCSPAPFTYVVKGMRILMQKHHMNVANLSFLKDT